MAYFKKLGLCLLTGLVVSITAQRIVFRAVWEFGNKRLPPPIFAIAGVFLILLAVIIYSIVWQSGEKKGSTDSQKMKAAWEDILSGSIALDLALFGWQKLFHLQFSTPLARLDEPISQFSGEALTWAYFGHSYPFTVAIGICQITGAIFLLFRRTRLFGAIFLFPVLLNIVLLNLFYGFEAGDLAHAAILLIGLLYLIFLHYRRLAAFFFRWVPAAARPFKRETALAASIIILPLVLVISFGPRGHNPQLTGKYTVRDLSVNGVSYTAAPCPDSVLTRVYFDQEDDLVLEFNSPGRKWIGHYRYDPAAGKLMASWRYPAAAKDTLVARLEPILPGQWRITGFIGKDSLTARLERQ